MGLLSAAGRRLLKEGRLFGEMPMGRAVEQGLRPNDIDIRRFIPQTVRGADFMSDLAPAEQASMRLPPVETSVLAGDLVATQSRIRSNYRGSAERALAMDYRTRLPNVVRRNGRAYVLDGHNRLAEAIESGAPLRVRLRDLDTAAGRTAHDYSGFGSPRGPSEERFVVSISGDGQVTFEDLARSSRRSVRQ